MAISILDFNEGALLQEGELESIRKQFFNSNIEVLDRLLARQHISFKQIKAASRALVSATRNFSPDMRADLTNQLIIRLPFAATQEATVGKPKTASLISYCLLEQLTGVDGKYFDYVKSLNPYLSNIGQVLLWSRQNPEVCASSFWSTVAIATSVVGGQTTAGLQGSKRKVVQHLFDDLDNWLIIPQTRGSSWYELHESARQALGVSKEESKVYSKGYTDQELLNSYKPTVSAAVGENLTNALFSDESSDLWNLAKNAGPSELVPLILQLAKARCYYISDVGSHRHQNPLSRLAVLINKRSNWRELYRVLAVLNQRPLNPSDSQMAGLIKSMGWSGGYPNLTLINQAFWSCRDGSHPETYEALNAIPYFEEFNSAVGYSKLYKLLNVKLAILNLSRFLYGGLRRR